MAINSSTQTPLAGDVGEQEVKPNQGDTEINPGQLGNNTEVDLDRNKIADYPQAPETPEK